MLCILVFSVDYNDELDILVSGFVDFIVKVWVLFVGTCLNIFIGYTEWVIKVGRFIEEIWTLGFVGVGELWVEWRMVDVVL